MFAIACAGCQTRFASGLMRCPRCKHISPQYAGLVKEEETMPKITVAAGPSNADAKPGEVGYIEHVEHKAAEVASEVAAEVHDVADWVSKPLSHLREAAKERNLSAAGSKADLAARIAEHEAGQTAADASSAATVDKEVAE